MPACHPASPYWRNLLISWENPIEMTDRDTHNGSDIAADEKAAEELTGNPPRLADVATLAGVSTATVSRALNQSSAVTPELRKRVHAAVDTLGYVPHGAARALASRRSNTIGAVVPTIDNAIFSRTIQALQARLVEADLTLLLACNDYDYARERREVQRLVERGIDGLILVGEEREQSIYDLLEKKRIPYVNTWIYRDDSPHPCVGFDNWQAAYQVGSYLLDIGHNRIAMVAGTRASNDRAAERVRGVESALADRGIRFASGHLVECDYEIAEGRRAASRLLASPERPTAIVCGNDVLAFGVLFECRSRGVDVPGEISITGFDDQDLAANIDPPLTTIHVPTSDMGRRAADYLLAKLDKTPVPEKTELHATLVIRETTAPPPTAT
jgi:LacI family transcriptional regulator